MQTDEELKERGLKRVTKYCCMFWRDNEWIHLITDDVKFAMDQRGYGDFAGMGSIECVVPLEAELKEKV